MGAPGESAEPERARLEAEIAEVQKQTMVGVSVCEKQGFELIELEEAIKNDGGCWLKFMKLPQPEAPPEDKGGKKAPPKKGQNPDDIKPIFGRAWVDLSDLQKPGSNNTMKRAFLETCPTAIKEAQESGDVWVDQEEFEPVFEPQRTYIYLEINLSSPVIPNASATQEPNPDEIVAAKTLIKWPFSKTATDDFGKQCAVAVKALTREYHQMFQ